MKFTRSAAALFALVLFAAPPAHAQRGTQLSQDGFVLMVNKRLGSQLWSIIVEFDFGAVFGNVYNLDGSDPVFLSCNIVSPVIGQQEDFIGATVELDCFAADGCNALPCGGDVWTALGTRSVPGSFFLPAEDGQSFPTPARTPTPSVHFDPPCGAPQCEVDLCGTVFENACPDEFIGDGFVCNCGCQVPDPDCFPTRTPNRTSTPQRTPTPQPTFTFSGGGGGGGGGGDFCCKHCTNSQPCGDSCISRSFTCHQPNGCACP